MSQCKTASELDISSKCAIVQSNHLVLHVGKYTLPQMTEKYWGLTRNALYWVAHLPCDKKKASRKMRPLTLISFSTFSLACLFNYQLAALSSKTISRKTGKLALFKKVSHN